METADRVNIMVDLVIVRIRVYPNTTQNDPINQVISYQTKNFEIYDNK